LMIDFAKLEIPIDTFNLISAVPLHYIKLKDRGFNQPHLLVSFSLLLFDNSIFMAII